MTLALRLSGEAVPAAWAAEVAQAAEAVTFDPGSAAGPFDDDYHQYLVLNWALGLSGGLPFRDGVPGTARLIRQPRRNGAGLQELSLALLDMGDARQPDWARMRWRLWSKLSEPARQRLASVESLPDFEGFFVGFSRAGSPEGRA